MFDLVNVDKRYVNDDYFTSARKVSRPYKATTIDKEISEISSSFVLSNNILSFNIGDYDKTKKLTIDPITRFMGSYFGGNGNGNSIPVANVSSEFHVYEVVWDKDLILFTVDGTEIHSFSNNSNVPFNHDFFIILNVAMGGSFGGAIDENFTESTMEIDYVKVYQ
mgnify:CR=1 FL=1